MLRYYFDLTPQRKNMVADVQWNYTECPDLHDHDHWEYLIITNGVCRNNINGSDYIMNKGDAVLIKPSDRQPDRIRVLPLQVFRTRTLYPVPDNCPPVHSFHAFIVNIFVFSELASSAFFTVRSAFSNSSGVQFTSVGPKG